MDVQPYVAGDHLLVHVDGTVREAIVFAVAETRAHDPSRQWRLLCRWADATESSIELPLHCGSDGHGDRVTPLRRAADAEA